MPLWGMLYALLEVVVVALLVLMVVTPLVILAHRARVDRREHWSWFHPGADVDTSVFARLPRHRIETVETPFRLPNWR